MLEFFPGSLVVCAARLCQGALFDSDRHVTEQIPHSDVCTVAHSQLVGLWRWYMSSENTSTMYYQRGVIMVLSVPRCDA